MSSTLAIDILARGGSQAAAEMDKVARATDKTGAALKKNSKISVEAAKASAVLTKARNSETDALDKVQVAESRLSDVRQVAQSKVAQVKTAEKDLLTVRNQTSSSTSQIAAAESKLQSARASSDSSTSRVLAGEKALAKARRDAAVAGNVAQKAAKDLGKILDNEGKKAGSGFGKSVLHWFTGAGKDVEKAGREAGSAGGQGFLSALTGVLKTPVLGPIVIAGLVTAVAAAAVPVGAVVAGALVFGAGAGLSAIGLKFAAESEAVKSIWSKTASDLGAQMRTISKPFESTFAALSVVARRTFAGLKPELAGAFKTLAPAVAGFGDQLGRAFEKLGPALQPLAGAFSKVLGALGPAMNTMFAGLSANLTKLSASISKSPTALADFTKGIGGLTGDLIGLVTDLNNADAAFKRLTGTSAVTVFMGAVRVAVASVIGPIDLLAKGFTAIANATKWAIDRQFPGQAQAAAAAATAEASSLAKAAAAHLAHANAAAHSAHATHEANAAAALLAGTYDRQAAATQRAIDALNRMADKLLSLSGAQTDYAQAVLDTTQAIKDNGKTHDLNTQKGISNQKQLDTFTQSIKTQRDAMLTANDGNIKAAEFAEVGRAAYVKFAQQMGYNKVQAQALAAEYIKIPPVVRSKLTANITDMQSKLAIAQTALKSPHLTATKKAKLEAEISNLKSGIATGKALLATLPQSRTAKLQADKTDLEAKIATAQKELANKNLTKERRAKLTADIANAKAGIATINGMLGSLPGSKTITVTTRLVTIKSSITSGSGVGGGHSVVGKGSAGGGLIPGAPSSVDNHLRPMATGEFVVQASKVPGNIGVLKAINDGKYKAPSGGSSASGSSAAVGSSVASGMAQGMLGNAATAYAAAAQVAAGMIAKAKSVLGIASPSKAFAQLGLYINQGFKIGLLGSSKSVQSVMSSLMSKVLNIAFNAADTKKAIQKTITSYNTAIAAARKKIKPVTSGMSKSEAAKTERNNAAAAASIKALRAKLAGAKVDLANVQAIASRLGTTVKRNAVLGMLQRENVAMQKLANARAVVANQLKAAQTKLAAAIQVRDDFKKSITDAALSFNSIINVTSDPNQSLGSQDILDHMQATLAKTKTFANELAKLKALGIRGDLYKQIADAGVDGGSATAAALLQGGKAAINQANSLQGQIATASAGLGNTAAKNMYQAGVDAAQGLVNGLLAKTKALDAASKKLAAAIVAQIKKTLGIHSPSKVMEWHGSMAAVGFTKGIEGEYGRVMKASAGLGAAAIPARGNKTGTVRSTGGEVRVVLEFKTDGSAHMERLAADVRKYVRATAGGNVQLAFGTGK